MLNLELVLEIIQKKGLNEFKKEITEDLIKNVNDSFKTIVKTYKNKKRIVDNDNKYLSLKKSAYLTLCTLFKA